MKRKINVEKLPIYEIVFDDSKDDAGITKISLVDKPAILVKGMYFSEDANSEYKFEVVKDKQIIVGPACVPGMKILRYDDVNDMYYYVVFKAETIRLLVDKFNRSNNNLSINVDHSKEIMVDGFLQANWIVEDQVYDKSKMYGFKCVPGTWFVEIKINDTDFWETQVKGEGKYGFSIEGFLSEKLIEMMEEESEMSMNEMIDSLSDDEILQIFEEEMEFRDANFHKFCKCTIVAGEVICEPTACDYCLQKKARWNSSAPGSKGFDKNN